MSTLIIACQMLEDEVQLALERTGCTAELAWVERRLHAAPAKLREAVESILRESRCDTALLAMCQCGNAFIGMASPRAALVLPRFSDCLHMLDSPRPGHPGQLDLHTLYLTRGWLVGEHSFLSEYNAFLAKHGPAKTEDIYAVMMAGYRHLCLVDTGAFPFAAAEKEARATAKTLGLSYGTGTGSTQVLERLFAGQWDEDFLLVPPGATIQFSDFVRTPL